MISNWKESCELACKINALLCKLHASMYDDGTESYQQMLNELELLKIAARKNNNIIYGQ